MPLFYLTVRIWINGKNRTANLSGWKLEDGAMTVVKETGAIQTKQAFGDIQLHLEWRAPAKIEGEGQGRGNSGVYLQGRYEVQILDCYNNTTYVNGQTASVYKQHIPLANACRPPGEWQTYDIVFMAPRFNDNGSLFAPATVTVLHNGVLVQNHVTIQGTTEHIGLPAYKVPSTETTTPVTGPWQSGKLQEYLGAGALMLIREVPELPGTC